MQARRLARIFGALSFVVSTSSFADMRSSGSGFAIGDGSLIVTANHVVKDCSAINIPDVGSAKVLRSDPKADIAIVKPNRPLGVGLRFRSGHPVKLGEEVVVIGFPLHGLLSSGPTVTTGIVSSLAGIGDDRTQMQVSAPVQLGNSGGPVLDKSGNVVGVVVSKLDAIRAALLTRDIPQNVNFAIQSSIVTSVLDSYSIDYKVSEFEREKPTSEIVALAPPAIVPIECLGERKLETIAIPPTQPKEIPPTPPVLRGKIPAITAQRDRIGAVVGELRSCLRAVRSNPAYSTLLPHLRDLSDFRFTTTQLADDRTPSPAEAETLVAYINESIRCKDAWLTGIYQIVPRPTLIPRLLWAETEAILLQLVMRQLTWGAAAQQAQQLLESANGRNFPNSILW